MSNADYLHKLIGADEIIFHDMFWRGITPTPKSRSEPMPLLPDLPSPMPDHLSVPDQSALPPLVIRVAYYRGDIVAAKDKRIAELEAQLDSGKQPL